MSRRIQTKADVLGNSEPDKYTSRLLKYMPAEVVALYVGAIGIVPDSYPRKLTVLWIIFAFCAIATPLYLGFATSNKKKKPLWLQVLLASIAFPVWAYALGGPFMATRGYEPFIGSLLLMAVTFLFGLIKPKQKPAHIT